MMTFLNALIPRRRWVAVVAMVSALWPASYLPTIVIDNSIDVWLPHHSEEYRRYQKFLSKYGSDEFVVVGINLPDPFAPDALRMQAELAERIRKIDGVDRVWDLPSLSFALWHDEANWQQKASRSTFLKNAVLGSDGRTAGMFIWLKSLHGPEARRTLIESIESVARAVDASQFEIHMAGAPLMNVALDRASARDSALFLPLAIGVCVLTLVVMLRTISGVVAPMCAVGVSAAWTVGLMAMTGHTLNVVTVVMPTLHFVLGLSNGIRLASRYQMSIDTGRSGDDAIRDSLRELMLPLLFMSITMAVGFLSLLGSDLEPIVELGEFSAIGLIIAFVSNVLIVPGVLSFFPVRARPSASPRKHWSARSGTAIARYPKTVVSFSVLMLVASAALLPRLRIESNVLTFFPTNSIVARDYEFIGTRLSGFYTVELDVTCSESSGNDTLDAIKKLEKRLKVLPHVVRVDHVGKADDLPQVAQAADHGASSPLSGLAEHFYAEEEDRVSFRVCVLVNAMGSEDYNPLLSQIHEHATKVLPHDCVWNVTGIVSLLNDAQGALVDTQVRSFSTALGIIVFLMGILFWSCRAAVSSILPNLVPIMLTFGYMAAAGINLDAATVMIASVAIGIAVDNTIYFLVRYREERRGEADAIAGIERTFNTIGTPITFTSVVAAAGFGILVFATFQPLVYFGMLTALTMLTALAGALFLTPACVQLFRVWEARR